MTWQITLFNWTGFVLVFLCMLMAIAISIYWIFDRWLNHLKFMWRCGAIAYQQVYGGGIKGEIWIDKDGTKFKIVEEKANPLVDKDIQISESERQKKSLGVN